jgi:hypothetical protein
MSARTKYTPVLGCAYPIVMWQQTRVALRSVDRKVAMARSSSKLCESQALNILKLQQFPRFDSLPTFSSEHLTFRVYISNMVRHSFLTETKQIEPAGACFDSRNKPWILYSVAGPCEALLTESIAVYRTQIHQVPCTTSRPCVGPAHQSRIEDCVRHLPSGVEC